jgi:hypothetical protein
MTKGERNQRDYPGVAQYEHRLSSAALSPSSGPPTEC